MPLFLVGFDIDFEILVYAKDKADALDAIDRYTLEEEFNNILDEPQDYHTTTELITEMRQVPKMWLDSDPYISKNVKDPMMSVRSIIEDLEKARMIEEDHKFAESRQMKLMGVLTDET